MIDRLTEQSKVIAASNSVQDQKGTKRDQTFDVIDRKKDKDMDVDMMGGVPYNNYPIPNAQFKPQEQQPNRLQQQPMAQVQRPEGQSQAQQLRYGQPLRQSFDQAQHQQQQAFNKQQPHAQQQNWQLKEPEAGIKPKAIVNPEAKKLQPDIYIEKLERLKS